MSHQIPHDTSFLARTHALADGRRVRLRLARRSDAPAVRALLADCGVELTELEISRLLSYQPRNRRVVAAYAQVGGRDRLVGIAAIDLVAGADPDTMVVEPSAGGLAPLLHSSLTRVAQAHSRRAA